MSVLFNILSLTLLRLCSIYIIIRFLVQRDLRSMWHYLYLTEEQSWGSESEVTCPGVTESNSVQDFFCLNSQSSLSTSQCARMASKQVTTLKTAERMGAPCISSRPVPRSATSPGRDTAPGGWILPKRLLQFPAAFCFPDKWQDPADH